MIENYLGHILTAAGLVGAGGIAWGFQKAQLAGLITSHKTYVANADQRFEGYSERLRAIEPIIPAFNTHIKRLPKCAGATAQHRIFYR